MCVSKVDWVSESMWIVTNTVILLVTVQMYRYRCDLLRCSGFLSDVPSARTLRLFCLQELAEEGVGSPIPEPRHRSRLFRSHSESSDELSELDLSHGKKDAFVLEVCICTNQISTRQL